MSTAGRVTKAKQFLMNATGLSLQQLNAMSAIDRSNLKKKIAFAAELPQAATEAQAATALTFDLDGYRTVTKAAPAVEVKKSKEEILAEIDRNFKALEALTLSTVLGANKSLIISGKAGVGKTFGVEKVVSEMSDNPVYVKGYCRATGLYRTLYENRYEGSTIVLDDLDNIFKDEVCLNILKAACDSSDVRQIHWQTETNMKDEDGELLPKHFEFEGSIIFITNYDFQELIDSGSKLAVHLEAMMSRSLYIDVGLRKVEEAMIRIEQVVVNCNMLGSLSESLQQEVLTWIDENKTNLRDLSLRTAKKLAALVETSVQDWRDLAKMTLCKKV